MTPGEATTAAELPAGRFHCRDPFHRAALQPLLLLHNESGLLDEEQRSTGVVIPEHPNGGFFQQALREPEQPISGR